MKTRIAVIFLFAICFSNCYFVSCDTKTKKFKVLIGSPIHQKPTILKYFLDSLRLLKNLTFEPSYCFVDDNEIPQSTELLKNFKNEISNEVTIFPSNSRTSYFCNEVTHYWSDALVWKVASFKNRIIEKAIQEKYDYLFLIDSDMVLNPNTLDHLISTNKDIVSNIFWTRWHPNDIERPQVWFYDLYTQYKHKRDEQLPLSEAIARQEEFFNQLKKPGTYEVGGLCACTLFSKHALQAGVNFKKINNVTFWGEDRHLCIRAAALGISLFVDTTFPAYHIYRESELAGVEKFIEDNKA